MSAAAPTEGKRIYKTDLARTYYVGISTYREEEIILRRTRKEYYTYLDRGILEICKTLDQDHDPIIIIAVQSEGLHPSAVSTPLELDGLARLERNRKCLAFLSIYPRIPRSIYLSIFTRGHWRRRRRRLTNQPGNQRAIESSIGAGKEE